MKHFTSEELTERFEAQGTDVVEVFDEEAMVVEQSRYRADQADEESTQAHPQDEVYYITSGSGHVYGYNLKTDRLDWDFYIGSDMDGSPVVTSDSCLMVPVEKQYIKGRGGAFKLDPSRDPDKAVEWYYPIPDARLLSWKGGIIGSVGINDHYTGVGDDKLAAFVGIDGHLYVVDHQEVVPGNTVAGPDSITRYPTPELVYKREVGPSISTPVFYENKLVVATYDGLYLFEYDQDNHFVLKDKFTAPFEATPVAYNNSIYVASRNGYLYRFSK